MQIPAPTIVANASLRALRDTLRQQHVRALCVVDAAGRLYGIVTLGDLQQAFEQYRDQPALHELTVGSICTRDVVTCLADDVLWTAIRLMGTRDIGRLPVLDARSQQLVGLLRRDNIMQAYNVAIARKLQDQHTAEQIRLNTLTGAHVLTYPVREGSVIAHRTIQSIAWPPEVIVASIQRQGKLIVPHGNTLLLVGDQLTLVADPQAESVLNTLFMPRA